MNKENKIFAASLIRDKKDILFGKFSDSLTHLDKVREWKNILNSLQSQGLLINKDWKYLRDTTWQNLKRGTVVKIDNSKQTGSAGGTSCVFTDLDNIIIDIIGKESPTLSGISDDSSQTELKEKQPSSVIINAEEDLKTFSQSIASKTVCNKRKLVKNSKQNEIVSLKKKRLQLEIYNLQLDARKKEKELELPLNRLTKELEGTEEDNTDPKIVALEDTYIAQDEENTISLYNY